MKCPSLAKSLGLSFQVTEISNVKCVTRLPKETKRQAVAIIFTDDSARTFTCDSGKAPGPHAPSVLLGPLSQWSRQWVPEQGQPLQEEWESCAFSGVGPRQRWARQAARPSYKVQ